MIVHLEDAGEKKISVIKVVRVFTQTNLKEAKALTDSAPVGLNGFSEIEAVEFADELNACGASAHVVGLAGLLRTVKVRIAALVSEDGKAICIGWGGDHETDEELMNDTVFSEAEFDGKQHFVFMDAELPLPPKPPTVDVAVKKVVEVSK